MNVFRKEDQPFSTQVIVDEAPAFGWVPHTFSFLRRHWTAGAIGFLACVGLGLAYIVIAPPTFTADTDLMIDMRRTDLLAQQHEQQDSQTLNAVLESQVEIMRSEGLARQVVQRMDLIHDPLFSSDEFSVTEAVRNFLSSLLPQTGAPGQVDHQLSAARALGKMTSVRRVGLTYVIQISVRSPSAELSARLANGIVDSYIVAQLAAKENTTKEASIWLQDRLGELRDQATNADSIVERYKTEKGIVATDKGLMNEQQLAELNSAMVAARSKSAEAKARLDRITTIMRGDVLDATVADGLQNTVINGLRLKYLEDVQQEAEWAAKYGPDHSAVVKIRAEMSTIQRSIRQELGRIAESYQSDYAVAHADEISAESRMRDLLSTTAQTNGDRVALRSLQSSAETYRSVYENFLRRYTQAVQDQSFPVSDARVITAATPPPHKSWPQSNLVLGGASFVGIVLGMMVAFIRETLDRGIRSTTQLRMVTGLNCIGMLPGLGRGSRLRKSRSRQVSTADANARILSSRPDILRHVLAQPNSKFSEGIRALSVRICRGHQRSTPTSLIGVVSAHEGEGTSTVAANLAQTLAKAGNRTLLVDWASNAGSLSAMLAPHAKLGFLDLLAGSAKLDEAVWSDPDTGLHFLPMGSRSARVISALINDPRTQDVRSDLLRHYEFVVFDIPALSPVAEIHAATQLLDAFVLVVAWGRADPDTTLGALTGAELDDRRFLGAVFNGVDFRSHMLNTGARSERPVVALT